MTERQRQRKEPPLPGLEAEVAKIAAARKQKAITVTDGAVRVRIYPMADGRWCVSWRETKGAPRQRIMRKSLVDAKDEAAKLCTQIANGRTAAGDLSEQERMELVAARRALGPLGISIDTLAREAVEAHRLTAGAGIIETARFWARHHKAALAASVPLREIHNLLVRSLEKQDFSPRWSKALTLDLGHFVAAFATNKIIEITAEDIEAWLAKQPGNWRTYNNRLMLIRQLFAFARKKNFLPADQTTEPKKIDPIKRPRGAHSRIGVLSAGELAEILENVGPHWLPYVAIGAFTGLRREEIQRLEWSDVRWDEKLIHVRQEVAKSTRRLAGDERFVPMRDQLIAWLGPWSDKRAGKVCPRKSWDDEKARLRKAIKNDKGEIERPPVIIGKWPKNAFRHTYGSCRTWETKNMAQVAHEMGNSVAEVRRDYNNPRTEREVQAWAALYPKGWNLENVVPFNGVRSGSTEE